MQKLYSSISKLVENYYLMFCQKQDEYWSKKKIGSTKHDKRWV